MTSLGIILPYVGLGLYRYSQLLKKLLLTSAAVMMSFRILVLQCIPLGFRLVQIPKTQNLNGLNPARVTF